MVGQKSHLRAIKRHQIKFQTCASFSPLRDIWLVVLQLILASKLSDLEHFENLTANNQFRKQKGVKMIPN